MGEPILDPGRQAGMCVYDGAEWRKAAGDADGRVHVNVLSSTKVKLHAMWDTTVPADGTVEPLATTSGYGRVFACMFRIDGATASSRYSEVWFYIDGEATPSSVISPDHIYWYLCGSRVVDLSLAGIVAWDTTNHIYHGWWAFGPSFESSIRIVIKNKDTANPIVVRVGIWIEWLK